MSWSKHDNPNTTALKLTVKEVRHLVGGRQLIVGPGVVGRVERKGAIGVAIQGSHAGGAVCAGVGGVDARRIIDCRISRAGGAAVQRVLVHCTAPRQATVIATISDTADS